MTGAITQNIDVAQVVLYVFWIFFAGLIIYLRREDKREGYPLETDLPDRVVAQGYPEMPRPKVFRLSTGEDRAVPRDEDLDGLALEPAYPFPGAPLVPTGDPLRDAVGPASYALRDEVPDRTLEGENKIVPMRVAADFSVATEDPDPRGIDVRGADGHIAGTVVDLWVDRVDQMIRYFEIEVPTDEEPAPEEPVALEPAAAQPTGEAPASEAPMAEAPEDGAPISEAPQGESPMSEAPAGEMPAAEAAASDLPEVDAPMSEAPAAEAPISEAPISEAPVAETPAAEAPRVEAGTRRVLVPYGFATLRGGSGNRHLKVVSLYPEQLAHVPGTASPDEITRREEDRICAYYGGGHLYANPMRQEPFL